MLFTTELSEDECAQLHTHAATMGVVDLGDVVRAALAAFKPSAATPALGEAIKADPKDPTAPAD